MSQSHWLSLEEPWRMAIVQAWEAYVGGNVGVGAVLTDADSKVVAAGRNRQSDTEAPPGRLRATPIAHAEIDVLGQLERGDYSRYTLWTTLESCPLCSMATITSNVGTVVYAARDRLWEGLVKLTQVNEFIAQRWPIQRGPLGGAVSAFCELLPLLWFLDHKPSGTVVEKYRIEHPRLLSLAKALSGDSRLSELKSHPVEVALAELWTELSSVENE